MLASSVIEVRYMLNGVALDKQFMSPHLDPPLLSSVAGGEPDMVACFSEF
jgi:hypothetical protein